MRKNQLKRNIKEAITLWQVGAFLLQFDDSLVIEISLQDIINCKPMTQKTSSIRFFSRNEGKTRDSRDLRILPKCNIPVL